MKITVLGGGGVRSMFLAKSIAQKAKRLGIDELCFMDNDEEKLRIYGGMAAHVARLLCPEMRFSLTADPVEAVRDANYPSSPQISTGFFDRAYILEISTQYSISLPVILISEK